ncbi:hypothetical protein CONLIGDRAFT_107832 [Coniochaeta ligniaria NRRL 30616]|uniref:Uncharacterized protein n=1 Tax=Coniochaeta ligniaria NRRL 30616 TaxID=1408157 RepID=A0A1J7I9T6_9PEZI|nr:hypothetical protein CONLIGDRAFT_107832 [Coniochaeta ligniaria NRRL 30616]
MCSLLGWSRCYSSGCCCRLNSNSLITLAPNTLQFVYLVGFHVRHTVRWALCRTCYDLVTSLRRTGAKAFLGLGGVGFKRRKGFALWFSRSG